MNIPTEYNWPDRWEPVSPEQGTRLAAQLGREVGNRHTLFGVPVAVIARRGDCDDVLFALGDGPAVAVVHLTYSRATLNAEWPGTVMYADVQAWADAEGRETD